jgi:site-specific DNA-methyltransferase (adenine-specific)
MEQLTLLDFVEPRRQPESHNSNIGFKPVSEGFQLQYEHPHGRLYQGDSISWLASLDNASVDLVFADPPYNIKKADWDSFESQE